LFKKKYTKELLLLKKEYIYLFLKLYRVFFY